MEVPQPAPDFRTWSEEELIRGSCAAPPNHAALDELCRRVVPTLQVTVRSVVLRGLKPPGWYSLDLFLENVLSAARLKFITGLKSFRFESKFSTWLYRIAKNAAVDELRRIISRGKEANPPVSGSDVLEKLDAGAPPSAERDVAAQRRREFLDKVLDAYAEQSPEAAECVRAIRWRHQDDLPIREITDRLGTYERAVYWMFAHDYEQLQGLLRERHGITNPEQI